ncbi:RNA polymerase I transcription termination factor/ RNA polymerase II transcription factor Reb1 [Schizosaccharomyces osmophilus]|uniref:RNA polymerase I transcription termination factor/ RNA polymerase II transcription factor Reb1 n=1 Tax=Schizosaccharomyces osmophilus TaxID=2545709 RepID=A0AAE9WB27_9SCHI|nr:RNA polymerase I transcription termination factor/ RNA polymerase II transcription factor Reb1 [Schizosaccharomyces osmophilus]WBW72688.1 RNA polymerase I transcription termination factor/ RNA polymerase II transcription factor Reb1 [Schizosaccharomyces osmophilus]
MNSSVLDPELQMPEFLGVKSLERTRKRKGDFDDTFSLNKGLNQSTSELSESSEGLSSLNPAKESRRDDRSFEALMSLQTGNPSLSSSNQTVPMGAITAANIPLAVDDLGSKDYLSKPATDAGIVDGSASLASTGPLLMNTSIKKSPPEDTNSRGNARWTAEHWDYLEQRMQEFCDAFQMTHQQVGELLQDKRLHGPLSSLVKILVDEMPSFTRRTILRHLRAFYNIPGYEKYSRRNSSGKGDFGVQETAIIAQEVRNFILEQGWTEYQFCNQIWAGKCPKPIRSFYSNLYKKLSHRDAKSIYHHVRRAYNPFEERCVWSKEEDEELRRNVLEHGKCWTKIGRKMARMPNDCRDRWRDAVRFGDRLKRNAWSLDEETQLLQIVAELRNREDMSSDINWTLVAQLLGTRTRLQCRYKFQQLTKSAPKFELQDNVWLLERIYNSLVKYGDQIHWDAIVREANGRWSRDQMLFQFINLKKMIPSYDNLPLLEATQSAISDFKVVLSGFSS